MLCTRIQHGAAVQWAPPQVLATWPLLHMYTRLRATPMDTLADSILHVFPLLTRMTRTHKPGVVPLSRAMCSTPRYVLIQPQAFYVTDITRMRVPIFHP